MKLNETRYFMERMKVYYPSLVIDDFTTQEWHSQLKDYSSQDINEKFNEHLKSEEYNKYIPKISFLTAYLVKEKEKLEPKLSKTKVMCEICNKTIDFNDYQNHFDRCSSVNYIFTNGKKYLHRNFDKQKMMIMDNDSFDNLYIKFCEELLKVIPDGLHKHTLENVILTYYGQEPKFSINELSVVN